MAAANSPKVPTTGEFLVVVDCRIYHSFNLYRILAVPTGRVIKIPVSRIPAGSMPVLTSGSGSAQILVNNSGHLSIAPSSQGGHIVTIQKDVSTNYLNATKQH